MSHRLEPKRSAWRILVGAGIKVILILLAGLLGLGIGIYLSLRPFG